MTRFDWLPQISDFSVSYILLCEQNILYKGYTNHFFDRMFQHFPNGGCRTTRIWKPVYILHYEGHANSSEAIVREKFYKTVEGRIWLKENMANLNTVLPK